MWKNLQIEWMKIKHYRVFQVFSVLYMLGIVLIIYIFYNIYISMLREMSGGRNAGDFFDLFSQVSVWKTTCYATSFLLYLPGMIIIMLFINEVTFKTHRQNIIDGWSRETFILSKVSLIACFAVAITLMNIVATAFMCTVTKTHFSIIDGLPMLGLSFLQSFVYLSLALLLATLLRRSGVAIIVFLMYGLLLEHLFMWLLSLVYPGLQHFLPLQVGDSLISYPKIAPILRNNPGVTVMVIAAIVYSGVYIYFTVRKYKYDDL